MGRSIPKTEENLRSIQKLGLIISKTRIKNQITQKYLCELCDISASSISRIEKGLQFYSISLLFNLLEILDLQVEIKNKTGQDILIDCTDIEMPKLNVYKKLEKEEIPENIKNFEAEVQEKLNLMQEQINILSETVKEIFRNAKN